MKFFGQLGEDFVVYKFFDGNKSGFYVDVGASDGKRFSNSILFERLGWQGICVEAHPFYYSYCVKNRPNAKVYNCAVSNSNKKELTFHASKHGALSCLDPSVANNYKVAFKSFDGYVKKFPVRIESINSLLTKNKVDKVDYLTIDIEGTEIDALKSFDIDKYQPKLFVIEAMNKQKEMQLKRYMKQFGYQCGRKVGVNYFFCLEEDVTRLKQVGNPPKGSVVKVPHVLTKKEGIRKYEKWLSEK